MHTACLFSQPCLLSISEGGEYNPPLSIASRTANYANGTLTYIMHEVRVTVKLFLFALGQQEIPLIFTSSDSPRLLALVLYGYYVRAGSR
jgi:hypothetical protein